MRITDSILLSNALLDQSRASQKLARLSQESATGNLINMPSDNPTGFAMVTTIDSQVTVLQGRNSVATIAANNIDVASGALSSAEDLLDQAKQIAIENANGTVDPATRAQAATQVRGIIQQMIQLGNAKGTEGYLFGGTETSTPPFDSSGNFVGNNGTTQVAVADGVLVTSSVSGAQAFVGAGGGTNVFTDLNSLATALSNNDVPGVTASIDQMDVDHEQITGVMVEAGATASTLQNSATLMSTLTTSTETARDSIDSAATAQVYSDLQATQMAYQTALDVTQQVLSLESFQSRIG